MYTCKLMGSRRWRKASRVSNALRTLKALLAIHELCKNHARPLVSRKALKTWTSKRAQHSTVETNSSCHMDKRLFSLGMIKLSRVQLRLELI